MQGHTRRRARCSFNGATIVQEVWLTLASAIRFGPTVADRQGLTG